MFTIIEIDSVYIRDGNVLIIQRNYRFVMKTTTKNRKRNDRFFKSSFLKKWSFLKTIVFQNDCFYKIRRFGNDR